MAFTENFKLVEMKLGSRVRWVTPDQVDQYIADGWKQGKSADSHKGGTK